jgi:hypothetical protein
VSAPLYSGFCETRVACTKLVRGPLRVKRD